MSAWKYKQVTPKVLVNMLRLIQPKDMLDLAERPLDQICSLLGKTPYQEELSEMPPQQVDSISLEDALLRNFVQTFDEIAQYSPKGIANLLDTTLMKFDASNVKAILRARSAGLAADEAMKYVVPARGLGTAECSEILRSSKDVHDVVKLLSGSQYGSVLEKMLDEYEKTGVLFPLEAALDKCVFGRIWKAVGKLRGLDGRIARTVLGLEVDSVNIRVILRCKEAGVPEDWVRQYLIPVSEVFSERELEGAVKAADVESAVKCLLAAAKFNLARDHQNLLTELTDDYRAHGSLSGLEMVMDRGLLRTSLRMLKRYTPFFNVGVVLAFLNLKWFELRNLRTIITGRQEDVPLERTKELLILPC
mgnify:CR=1 FL=1